MLYRKRVGCGIGVDLVGGLNWVWFWGRGLSPAGYFFRLQKLNLMFQGTAQLLSRPQSGSVEQSQRKVG